MGNFHNIWKFFKKVKYMPFLELSKILDFIITVKL